MQLDEILKKPAFIAVVIAIVLALLGFIAYKVYTTASKERLIGTGIDNIIFTSGATQRRLGTEFSEPSQGEYTTPMLADIKELIPGVVPSGAFNERLVSERAEPNFWEIGSELDAYREQQAAGFRTDMARGKERLSESSIAGRVQEELLRQQLWR